MDIKFLSIVANEREGEEENRFCFTLCLSTSAIYLIMKIKLIIIAVIIVCTMSISGFCCAATFFYHQQKPRSVHIIKICRFICAN